MDLDSIPSPSRAAPSPPPVIIKLSLPITSDPMDIPVERVTTIEELKYLMIPKLKNQYPAVAENIEKIHLFYGGNELSNEIVVGELRGIEERHERIQIAIAGDLTDAAIDAAGDLSEKTPKLIHTSLIPLPSKKSPSFTSSPTIPCPACNNIMSTTCISCTAPVCTHCQMKDQLKGLIGKNALEDKDDSKTLNDLEAAGGEEVVRRSVMVIMQCQACSNEREKREGTLRRRRHAVIVTTLLLMLVFVIVLAATGVFDRIPYRF
ncbi:hypothetical protein HDV05_005113 [Chytridiales sp. JEL 0842]|nr:hypothetical protein HDV05_005113 [Chytridiales sp. JEL 0842]